MSLLDREEYIEQAYLFRALGNRTGQSDPVQELLAHIRHEVLATTKLPLAIDYLLAELNHVGTMSTAMKKMPHYFTAFQSFLIESAESVGGRFDMRLALNILEFEANFRSRLLESDSPNPVPMFFFQFETLSRNRLDYDYGLSAIAGDPIYTPEWSKWILQVRHQIGFVELPDLVYVHSQHYIDRQKQQQKNDAVQPDPLLFGEKEGRIALANKNKDPMYLFAALQRQLNYPSVPRPKKKDPKDDLVPKLVRMVDRLEMRVKLLEDEQRDRGIDLSQFFEKG